MSQFNILELHNTVIIKVLKSLFANKICVIPGLVPID